MHEAGSLKYNCKREKERERLNADRTEEEGHVNTKDGNRSDAITVQENCRH